MKYINKPDILPKYRPLHLERSDRYNLDYSPSTKNLQESLERLIDMGLVDDKEINGAIFTWARCSDPHVYARCCQTFKIIYMNPDLDSEIIPDRCFDKVLYHECLHLRQTIMRIPGCHDDLFKKWECVYPDFYETRRELRRKWKMLHDTPQINTESVRVNWKNTLDYWLEERLRED